MTAWVTSDSPMITQASQIGTEVTSGVAVPATKIYQGMSFDIQPNGQADLLKPEGSKLAVVSIVNTEWAESNLTLLPDYQAIAVPLSGIVLPEVTNDGAAYQRVYTPSTRKVDGFNTWTFEKGDNKRAKRTTGNTLTEFGFDASRQKITFNGKTMGHKMQDNVGLSTGELQTITVSGGPTGGTFTLTFAGQTANAIPYNVDAATLQGLLDAAWTDTPVLVAGGPLPVTPITVRFKQNGNVALITSTAALTGGAAPAVAIAETSAGTLPIEVAAVGMSPQNFDLFIDAASEDFGTTLMERAFALSVKITGLRNALWAMNSSNPDYAAMVDTEPSLSFTLTLGYDDAAMDVHAAFQQGLTRYVRFQSQGAAIAGSASNYLYRFDGCFKFDKPVNFTNQDNIVVATQYTGQVVHDATWGKGYQITNIGTLDTI